MNSLSHALPLPFKSPYSRLPAYLLVGAASLGTLIFLRSRSSSESGLPKTIPSPRRTLIPHLSEEEAKKLPYPPDALPGIRDVDSPYGSVRVYEWGPEDGDKVLLIHGISTPSIALAHLANKLVEKGCRVMLFDLFGRGYSDAPSSETCRYNSALYTTQIHLCLESSPLHWSSFTLIGYSLGGAISADFTSYFPYRITNLILVAPGGLIRTKHITWRNRLIYSRRSLLPDWLIQGLVSRRLWTGPPSARTEEPEIDMQSAIERERYGRRGGLHLSSDLSLLEGRPLSTVANVVDWQISNHLGFVQAFISSIRYAPVHDQHHRWAILGENVRKGVGNLKEVWMVLGEIDPIIVAEEVTEDAMKVLGEGVLNVRVVQGSGHEVPIERYDEVVEVVGKAVRGEKGW